MPGKIKNFNPPMVAEAEADGWLDCPRCGLRFKLTDKNRWKNRRHTTCGQEIKVTNFETEPTPAWCMVANIAEDIPFGEEQQIQKGTKHFSPRTKVYCYPPMWGDGYECIKAIARHRGSKKFVTMVVRDKWLTNCRAKLICNPRILGEISGIWDDSEKSQQLTEELARIVNERNQNRSANLSAK